MKPPQNSHRNSVRDNWRRLSRTEKWCHAFVVGVTAIVGVSGIIAGSIVAGLVFAGAAFLFTALPLAGVAAYLEHRRASGAK